MNKNDINVKILSALVCDDIRKENNGKEILIGVYSGRIIMSKLPHSHTLMVWLYMSASGPGSTDLEFRGFDPSNRIMFTGKMTVNMRTEGDTLSGIIPRFDIEVEKEGKLKIQYRKLGEKWRTIVNKDVVLRQQSSTPEA